MAVPSLGPWPGGADNVHDERESVFQPGGEQQTRAVALVNGDWDDDGWPKLRAGTTNRRVGTAYKNVVSCAGLLLLQDGGTIYKIDPDDSFAAVSLVTGLNATTKVQFHEFNGDCYYTNGYVCGKVLAAGTATHWGLTVPPVPTLATTPGDLPAGKYRVIVTLLDAVAGTGVESGATKAADITVNGTTDITVDLASSDANATHVNVYVSPQDEAGLFWNQTAAIGSLPITITDARVSTRPLLTQLMRNPIPADGVSSYLGYMFLWVDNVVFRSRGQVPDLFYPRTELLTFPFDVKTILGLQTGFYVATEKTLHWISGDSPTSWRNIEVDRGLFAAGGSVTSGHNIPKLGFEGLVALFGAKDGGLIVGLPDGQTRHVMHDQLALSSAPATADILYVKRDELRQIFLLLN